MSVELKRILVAVDLGAQSAEVLEWARWFAKLYGTRVDVVHAISVDLPPYFTENQLTAFAAELRKERVGVEKRLKRLAGDVLGNVPFEVTVVEGPAIEAIRRAVERVRPGLLMIGSHGHARWRRLLLGSVAENLFRESSCPTLVVKSKLPQAGVQAILCPVNFSELALECSRYSKALAEKSGAELFLLQAVEEPGADVDLIRDRLCQWHAEAGVAHSRVVEIVRRGHPVEEMVAEGQRHAIGLIVVGAAQRTLLGSLVIGRTTEQIVRLSPISVLVIPAGAPAMVPAQAEEHRSQTA